MHCRSFDLQLVPNRRLVSPQFAVWSEQGQEVPHTVIDTSCHYLHAGTATVAAFSACKDHTLVSEIRFTFYLFNYNVNDYEPIMTLY